jgi:hypothetical protein
VNRCILCAHSQVILFKGKEVVRCERINEFRPDEAPACDLFKEQDIPFGFQPDLPEELL